VHFCRTNLTTVADGEFLSPLYAGLHADLSTTRRYRRGLIPSVCHELQVHGRFALLPFFPGSGNVRTPDIPPNADHKIESWRN